MITCSVITLHSIENEVMDDDHGGFIVLIFDQNDNPNLSYLNEYLDEYRQSGQPLSLDQFAYDYNFMDVLSRGHDLFVNTNRFFLVSAMYLNEIHVDSNDFIMSLHHDFDDDPCNFTYDIASLKCCDYNFSDVAVFITLTGDSDCITKLQRQLAMIDGSYVCVEDDSVVPL